MVNKLMMKQVCEYYDYEFKYSLELIKKGLL